MQGIKLNSGLSKLPYLNIILLTESQWPVRMGEERSPSAMWRKVTRVRTPARPSTLKALCLPFLMGSSACLRDQTQVLHQLHMVRTSLDYCVFCIICLFSSDTFFSKETMDVIFYLRDTGYPVTLLSHDCEAAQTWWWWSYHPLSSVLFLSSCVILSVRVSR